MLYQLILIDDKELSFELNQPEKKMTKKRMEKLPMSYSGRSEKYFIFVVFLMKNWDVSLSLSESVSKCEYAQKTNESYEMCVVLIF